MITDRLFRECVLYHEDDALSWYLFFFVSD